MSKKFINRIKKPLRDNAKGFSLVELLVCIAILGIIAVCVGMMLNAGTNSYTRINKRVNASYRTQIALTQLKEFFIDCDGICEDEEGNIFILNTDNSGNKIIYLFTFDADENEIYLETFSTSVDEWGNLNSNGTKQPFANHITAFGITVNESRATGSADTVLINITSTFDNVSNSRNQIFAMKNKPLFVDDSPQEGESIVEEFLKQVQQSQEIQQPQQPPEIQNPQEIGG